ncbi:hypothetical protein C8R46DRAFT_1358185 [Mycena filopes]|nr:hypothetical protein C8R46DRAFT_1358185 [Mycena filopes]
MLQQVDGLWFSTEKLVVLRAREQIFRLPQFTLAARSPVFEAMFQFPQPDPNTMNTDQETIDGVPVITLFDLPSEVEPFLRAIFDSSYFMPPPANVSFYDVLGVLRLSHKYDVAYLYQRALLHLETIYPVHLASVPDSRDDGLIVALTAIPVLHAVEANWLLPYAYYAAATFNFQDCIDAGEAWNRLPLEMQQPPPSCASEESCTNGKQSDVQMRLTHRANYYKDCQDPLSEWKDRDWDHLGVKICEQCMDDAQNSHANDVSELWEELPSNCGLGTWDALLEARKVALE